MFRIRTLLTTSTLWVLAMLMLCNEENLLAWQTEPASQEVDKRFERVFDLFKARCFECHGQDSREGGLRLSNSRDAFVENDSGGVAISPGNLQQSELIRRIKSRDGDLQMPPDGERLSPDEVDLLETWIKEGAPWPKTTGQIKHWAYVAPRRSNAPAPAEREADSLSPIDFFIQQRLTQHNLTIAKQERPERLLRRVSLALTGLPPSPERVDRFKSNPTLANYEQFVDQCLNDSGFGERWAQPWLDLARYADSNGYQADQLRESWAYRDWVINAINSDMPFDKFSIEQLAGDLLENPTLDQKIATGFHRTTTCNVEAGVHPEENRINQIFDRVNTTGTVFLGTTLECCQCHNHKYDPFTQDDYYQIFAFFNNTPIEVKFNSGVQYEFNGPSLDLPRSRAQTKEVNKLSKRLSQIEKQLQDRRQSDQKQKDKLKSELKHAAQEPGSIWRTIEIMECESTGGETVKVLEDNSILFTGSVPSTSTYTVRARVPLKTVTAIQLEALTHPDISGMGPGRGDEIRTNFVLNEFSVWDSVAAKNLPLVETLASFSQKNYPIEHAIDGKAKTGWAIAPKFKQDHWARFQLQKPVSSNELKVILEQNFGRGRTLGRIRLSVSDCDPRITHLPEPIRKILARKKLNAKESKTLDQYLDSQLSGRKELIRERNVVKSKLDKLKPPTTLVMVEMDKARETKKLIRGNYLSPGKAVQPGVPSVLHRFPGNLPKNRLGFAKWLFTPENPLTARVTVNRWWSQLMGNGLVKSEEDFGTQSDPPTHPELLDWLAVELIKSNWSRKHIIKTIVMSHAYRQSALMTPKSLESDPQNRWYARGPRLRMPAEMIRDSALSASGLLSRTQGGPPIMPFQPPNIWRAVGRNAPKWNEQFNKNRFRRGVYVVWRRAAPYPSFINFDAPDRAACVVKRPSTNTPLQALTLLNDPAFQEASFALACRARVQGSTSNTNEDDSLDPNGTIGRDGLPARTIQAMMRQCLSRQATVPELRILLNVYQNELIRFQGESDSASDKSNNNALKDFSKLIQPGFKSIDSAKAVELGLQRNSKGQLVIDAEIAAMTVVANVILNLDEFINY